MSRSRHWSGKDGDGADGEAYVAIGVLGVEEPRVQHCQLLHDFTVCHLRTPRQEQRSLAGRSLAVRVGFGSEAEAPAGDF